MADSGVSGETIGALDLDAIRERMPLFWRRQHDDSHLRYGIVVSVEERDALVAEVDRLRTEPPNDDALVVSREFLVRVDSLASLAVHRGLDDETRAELAQLSSEARKLAG